MSEKNIHTSLRWNPYFMQSGLGFSRFWEEYLERQERRILYVLGKGFDPRMCVGVEALLNSNAKCICDCALIVFDEGRDSPSAQYVARAEENQHRLETLIRERGQISLRPIQVWSDQGPQRRRIGSRNAASIFKNMDELASYTDVIIDISAMPRGIYFPLIAKFLLLLDSAHRCSSEVFNLFVIVSEDVTLDKRIYEKGIDDIASYLHGFGSGMEMETTAGWPRVWIPILGENQESQLERIYSLIHPDEICPVLPWPSRNPRRADEILVEYRDLMFDQWRVEPRNIFYASEQNPFENYRRLHQVIHHYIQALAPLGGCKIALSALSSKLLSIGVLLVAYELLSQDNHYVGIAQIDAQGYEIDECASANGELFTLCLSGDFYEQFT